MAEKVLDGVHTKKPKLEAFDEKITYLYKVKNVIQGMEIQKNIGWLRIHSSPLRDALLTIVTTWIKKYTSFLLDNTLKEISNIQQFINEVNNGIKVRPENAETDQEKKLLMQVMTHLRDVKMIQERAIGEIEPMKDTIVLLKKHGETFQEDYLVALERDKNKLKEVGEYALGPVKEEILPL